MSNYWERMCNRFEKLNVHLKVLVCMLTGILAAMTGIGLAVLLFVIASVIGGAATAIVALMSTLYLMLYFIFSDG